MLAGVSARRYRRTQEPAGSEVEQQARSTSKSSVSRTFVEQTRVALGELMSRRLDDVRLAVMMIDGIDLGERTNVVALGITTEGVKIPLGLWEGSTENAAVATALLTDLVERGLDPEQGILFVIDGAKALRKAIRTVFGDAPVQRCVRHKERNVLDHLPERDRPAVKQRTAESVGARRRCSCARPAPPARPRTRPLLPRRRQLAAGRHRGDAHAQSARRRRQPQAHAAQHATAATIRRKPEIPGWLTFETGANADGARIRGWSVRVCKQRGARTSTGCSWGQAEGGETRSPSRPIGAIRPNSACVACCLGHDSRPRPAWSFQWSRDQGLDKMRPVR